MVAPTDNPEDVLQPLLAIGGNLGLGTVAEQPKRGEDTSSCVCRIVPGLVGVHEQAPEPTLLHLVEW